MNDRLEPLRRRLETRHGATIRSLQRLDARKRTLEALAFVALLAVSILVGLVGMNSQGILGWSLRGFGIVGVAVAFNAFLLFTHEAHHDLLAGRPWLNRGLALMFALPLLHAPTAYRVLHGPHHRHLGGPGDPDDYHNYTQRSWLLWVLHWNRLILGAFLYLLLIPLSALRRGSATERVAVCVEYAVLAVVYVAAFRLVPIDILAQVWLIPLLPVGYFTSLRGLAQHGFTHRHDPGRATRTFRSNALVAFALLNENYHLEHHLFPTVPSYHLASLHRLLRGDLADAVTSSSYLAFLGAFVSRWLRRDLSPIEGARRAAP